MRFTPPARTFPHEIRPTEFDEPLAAKRFEAFARPFRQTLLPRELRKKKDEGPGEIQREILRQANN